MQFSIYFRYKCDGILQPRSALGTSVGELTWKLRQVPDDVWIVDGHLRCHRALTGLRCLDERHVRYHQMVQDIAPWCDLPHIRAITLRRFLGGQAELSRCGPTGG